jgi:hypothetical protein
LPHCACCDHEYDGEKHIRDTPKRHRQSVERSQELEHFNDKEHAYQDGQRPAEKEEHLSQELRDIVELGLLEQRETLFSLVPLFSSVDVGSRPLTLVVLRRSLNGSTNGGIARASRGSFHTFG